MPFPTHSWGQTESGDKPVINTNSFSCNHRDSIEGAEPLQVFVSTGGVLVSMSPVSSFSGIRSDSGQCSSPLFITSYHSVKQRLLQTVQLHHAHGCFSFEASQAAAASTSRQMASSHHLARRRQLSRLNTSVTQFVYRPVWEQSAPQLPRRGRVKGSGRKSCCLLRNSLMKP